jgi:O-antigen/teichoic acid export membrane protein
MSIDGWQCVSWEKKRLMLNSLSGTSLYIISIIVAFIMSPVYIKALGNRDYGLWELVMSVIGYMGLLDMGIGPALVRFVSVASGREDQRDIQQTMSTALVFFLIIGAVSVFLCILLGYSPWIVAGKETKDIANVGTVFLLFGVNAGLTLPLQVFIATLMGVQRHYFINFSRGAIMVLNALVAWYLLREFSGKGLIILALLTPIFTMIQCLLFVGAVHLDKQIPGLSISAVSWIKFRELFSFGAKNAVMQVASRLQNLSVPFIIGNVIGLGSIVFFVMPNRLIDYAKGLSMAIGFPLTPYFGSTLGKGSHDELVHSWLSTTLALQIVTLAMPIAIFFYGESFLSLWIGNEYAVAGRWVIYFLLIGLVADSLATNAFRMLTVQGKHGRCAFVWLLLSVVSIPMGILGASLWGVTGATLGITTAVVVGNLVTIHMTCTIMQVAVKTFYRETIQRLLLPLGSLTVSLWVLSSQFPVTGYGIMIMHLLTGGVVYLQMLWFVTLHTETKKLFRERLVSLVS